jgi:hypothetical protein
MVLGGMCVGLPLPRRKGKGRRRVAEWGVSCSVEELLFDFGDFSSRGE